MDDTLQNIINTTFLILNFPCSILIRKNKMYLSTPISVRIDCFMYIISKRYQITSIFPYIYMIGFESIFLGCLGLIICEDLLWEYPTVDLVRTNNVDTIIFPTEWWDEYPHQLPHVDQASWAKSLQVLFHYTLISNNKNLFN